MNRCFFVFFTWVTNWASSIKTNNMDVFLPEAAVFVRVRPLRCVRVPISFFCRNCRDYRWKPVRKTQRRGRIFTFRRKPTQTAGAPLSLRRFYCDREQTRGIDFRIKLAYSLICDFLIQQFGFLNIWSGFIVVVFLLLLFFLFWAHSDMQRAGSVGM